MTEMGYSLAELYRIKQHQSAAIDVSVNALARIVELLGTWHIRPMDIEVCLQTAQNALEKIDMELSKNPLVACDERQKINRKG